MDEKLYLGEMELDKKIKIDLIDKNLEIRSFEETKEIYFLNQQELASLPKLQN